MSKKFPLPLAIEDDMIMFYESLDEKSGRHYASLEAKKLGNGGIKYISKLLGLSTRTIRNGIKELEKKASSRVVSEEKEEGENEKK